MITANSYTRLTLALDIVRRIPDGPLAGYHELKTIKHQISLCDEISLEESPAMEIQCNNPMVPCDERNICWKAISLLKREFDIRQNIRIGLNKKIPVMGGLAGGSANAATVLQLADTVWNLGLSTETLQKLARKLGMDVPYYFVGGTAFDTESTGILRPVATSARFCFVLVLPGFGVSTKEAYSNIDYCKTGCNQELTDLLEKSLVNGQGDLTYASMHNDFEYSVFAAFPQLSAIKKELLSAGCIAAFMSGSGSTMVGVAESAVAAKKIAAGLSYETIVVETMPVIS